MQNMAKISFKRSYRRSAVNISIIISVLLILISLASCRMPLDSFPGKPAPLSFTEPGERIEITEDTFTIAWDPDPQGGIPDSYRMYFRSLGNETWSLLSEVVPDMEPMFTITQDNLSFGIYEFAVSAVVGGIESDLHTSMDKTASPGTGWFVDWHSL